MAASFDAAVSGFNKLQALQALALLKLTGVESHALRSALALFAAHGIGATLEACRKARSAAIAVAQCCRS